MSKQAKSVMPMAVNDVLAAITDEMAQEDGYPDAESVRLEHQLGQLAAKWAKTQEPTMIKHYHDLYHKLIRKGWNPDLLSPQQVLPRELMPERPELLGA
jgi:hypothetical protein